MKPQMQPLRQKSNGLFTNIHKRASILRKERKIISVPYIPLHSQRLFHEPVKFVEVHVRKYLARDVADGNTARFNSSLSLSLSLSKTERITANDFRKKQERTFILHSSFKELGEDTMINVIEKFVDVPPPEPTARIRSNMPLRPFDRSHETFPLSARPRFEQECFIEDLHQIVVEESVHQAITEGGNGDVPLLRIAHRERSIRAVTVRSRLEFVGERTEILFQGVTKVFGLSRPLFSAHELPPAIPQSR